MQRRSLVVLAAWLCGASLGCSDHSSTAPGGRRVGPAPASSQSVSGGSANALSINNGVMKAAIRIVDKVTVLEVAGEEVLVYLGAGEVNAEGLAQWFRIAQDADAELSSAGQMKLQTIELTAGPEVPEAAVEACAKVIGEMGLEVEIQNEGRVDAGDQ